jgi:hypothetical protein
MRYAIIHDTRVSEVMEVAEGGEVPVGAVQCGDDVMPGWVSTGDGFAPVPAGVAPDVVSTPRVDVAVVSAAEALPAAGRYARVVGGAVVDVISLPAGVEPKDALHPSLAVDFRPCAAAVQVGWIEVARKLVAPPPPVVDMDEARRIARVRILAYANDLTRRITSRYPEAEVASWASQEAEARSVLAGAGADAVPLLAALVAGHNGAGWAVTLAEFAALVLTKAAAYRQVVAAVQVVRSQTEAAIAAATTQDDIDLALVAAAGQAAATAAQLGIGDGA